MAPQIGVVGLAWSPARTRSCPRAWPAGYQLAALLSAIVDTSRRALLHITRTRTEMRINHHETALLHAITMRISLGMCRSRRGEAASSSAKGAIGKAQTVLATNGAERAA